MPKRKRDATWFRDKVLLVEAQGSCKVLNEEELEFLADPRVAEGPVTQTVITYNAAYQADDLDAYDSDYDDFSTAKVVIMTNLSSYESDVLSEVPHSKHTHNDMLNQSVQEMQYFEQTHLVNYPKNEITNDSNIIPYSQYLLKTQNAAVQDINYPAQQDATILFVFEQLSNQSRSKMLLKQSDPMVLEKKVNIKPFNCAELNRLSEDFGKRFVPQQELSDKQAFRLQTSHPNTDQSASSPVKIKAPRELPKVSLVNTSLKKLKYHLGQFDNVVKSGSRSML
ncbi:hypothetical protein Tco_1394871 [Tanacetum coccineum]